MTQDIKQAIALTALNNMMEKAWFDLSTIDSVAKMLEVNCRGDAYNMLHPLHCIHWDKMPQEIRDKVPGLIQQCLGVAPVYQFKTMKQDVLDVAPTKKHSFLSLLGGKS